ncbi:hypothetical protein UlMin_033844 [Ulmus minor]
MPSKPSHERWAGQTSRCNLPLILISYRTPGISYIHMSPSIFTLNLRLMMFYETININNNTPASSSISCATPKSSAELEEEIARLELQIGHLERHLLSLYRTAFQLHFPSLPTSSPHNPINEHELDASGICYNQSPLTWLNPTPKKAYLQEKRIGGCGAHRSLADHLGASSIVNTPDRLSEDIVRCISSIFCKLGKSPKPQPQTRAEQIAAASPTSSLSFSTIFSSATPCESWSPRYNEDSQGLDFKQDGEPYAGMIQVRKIHSDDDSFNYAAVMLQNFRSLVRNLEKVDPRKMKREEKLAFWINIHNALVMHAHLAYGSPNRRMKSGSILKAAYNVGGDCINAYVIQSSILGIRPHHSIPWLQTLFPSGRKYNNNTRHQYALEYPEPLVHFALSSGEYSDPAVRLYTSKNIFEELRVAKEEFMKARVKIEEKEMKVLVPKIVDYFAKDMSLGMHELLEEVVVDSGRRVRAKPHTQIHWLPHNSTFGYVIHPHLPPNNTH